MYDFVFEHTTSYGAKLRIRPLAKNAFIRFAAADGKNNTIIDIPMHEARCLRDVLNINIPDEPKRAYRDSRGVVWHENGDDGVASWYTTEDGSDRDSLGCIDFDYGPIELVKDDASARIANSGRCMCTENESCPEHAALDEVSSYNEDEKDPFPVGCRVQSRFRIGEGSLYGTITAQSIWGTCRRVRWDDHLSDETEPIVALKRIPKGGQRDSW